MKTTMLLFLNLFSLAFGQVTHPLSEVNATQLNQVLQASANTSSATNRLLEISASFLGSPYLLGPAGEGVDGDFDQRPLSTWEKFDCVTYVEAVLALSLIHNPSNDPQVNLQMYYQNLIEIKYSDDSNISFLTRNHFTEIDWLPHLNHRGLLRDITHTLSKNIALREKIIDKKQWFLSKTTNDLFLPELNEDEKNSKLEELKELVVRLDLAPVLAKISYVPFSEMDVAFLHRLPKISLFNLVRPDHPTLNVPVIISHQGLLIKNAAGEVFVRHASSKSKIVIDVPIQQYLRDRSLDSPWTSLGLNIQQINL